MDDNEGGGGFGDGNGVGDSSEQFHPNEAISAVVDEGFLGEEDDEYEDLYNDVNVGENFLQSLRRNEDFGYRVEEDKKVEQPVPPPQQAGVGSNGGNGGDTVQPSGVMERKVEKVGNGGSGVPSRVDGYPDAGYRGNEIGPRGPVGAGLGTPVGGGLKVESQSLGKVNDFEEHTMSNSVPHKGTGQQPHATTVGNVGHAVNVGNVGNNGIMRQGGANVNGTNGSAGGGPGFPVGVGGSGSNIGASGGGGTILFVGDLHWWTTDADVEAELSKYGPVKEVKFFDEKASGKSKGYCQVEFYDPAAATACKEGMNGHLFNGRPCVVAFASPYSIKRMGEAQNSKNQQMAQTAAGQTRRGTGDALAKPGGGNMKTGGNYQGGGDNIRGFGRGNWGRGSPQGMGNRGPGGPMRNRLGGMVGPGVMGNGGGGFGQGIGAAPPLLHPQSMMGQGFDPAFGGPMGRMGSYGGFPGAPTPPFSGILPSFPPVGSVGLPGVAPHVNPSFFGRRMPMNAMGMMSSSGVENPGMGLWSDPNMGGWNGEEQVGRDVESSYAEEALSDHQYGEVSHDRAHWPNMKDKEGASERDWSGSSDRRYRDDRDSSYDREKDTGHGQERSDRRPRDDRDIARDRERERDRDREHFLDRERGRERDRERDRDHDRHKDDKGRYVDHPRYREREPEHDEWDRGRSSRTTSKSRLSHEEEPRSRSRDADYGKRRRLAA